MTRPSSSGPRRPARAARPDRSGSAGSRRRQRPAAAPTGPGRRVRSTATSTAPAGTTPARRGPSRLARQLTALGLVLAVVALSLAYPLRNYLDQKVALAAAVAEQRSLEQQLAELRVQQAALSDPDYLRQEAKKRLQYVLPGDTVYVVQAPLTAASAPDATAPADAGPWYSTLWDTLSAPPESAVDPAAVTAQTVPPADGSQVPSGGTDVSPDGSTPVAPTS